MVIKRYGSIINNFNQNSVRFPGAENDTLQDISLLDHMDGSPGLNQDRSLDDKLLGNGEHNLMKSDRALDKAEQE